jgi:hypothetical protein
MAFEPAVQPFDTLSAELTYEVLDGSAVSHSFRKQVKVRATQPVRFFENTFHWTGRGRIEPPVLANPQHSVHGPMILEGDQQVWMIYLGRQLAEGELETIELTQTLVDQQGVAQPYLRFSVVNPLDKLVLRVALPTSIQNHVRSEVWDLSRGRFRAPPELMLPRDNGMFVVEVDDPIVGVRYGVSWL